MGTSHSSSNKEILGCAGTVLAAIITGIFLLISVGKIPLPAIGTTNPPAQPATPTNIETTSVTPIPVEIDQPLSGEQLGVWIIVIGGGYQNLAQAQSDLQGEFSAYPNATVFYRDGDIRTVIYGFETKADAQAKLERLLKIRGTAYLRELNVWCPDRIIFNDHIECQ